MFDHVSRADLSHPAYTELHAHSAYSFLDGASLPAELAEQARDLGYSAFALTDHDSVAGSMEFAHAAKAAGIAALHGAEVTVRRSPHPAVHEGRDGPARPAPPGFGAEGGQVVRGVGQELADEHLTLLVESRAGWRNLCRLLTLAHEHTRDHPQRDRTDPSVTLEQVAAHAEGLICLSGCAAHGVEDPARLAVLREAFGVDGFRVELQRPYAREDRTRIRHRRRLAQRFGVPAVVSGNVHAHDRRRAYLQDAFVAARLRMSLDSSEALRRGNHAHVLVAPDVMARRFSGLDEALAETGVLAQRCAAFDLTRDLGYRYPGAEDPEMIRTLAQACESQFDLRYPQGSPHREEARRRLEQELRIIDRHRLAGFFVLHRDILELAREVAVEVRGTGNARSLLPPGRGRGSSVSSIVCYFTGLSHVDPIKSDLLLGRFLNEELTAFPDIDLDFPRDVREVLIPRIHERYGREHTALVATHPGYRGRGAIRDLGLALGLPPAEVARVAQATDGWSATRIEEDVDLALGSGRSQSGRWAWLCRLVREAQGLPRHLGQHPGGMIVATEPVLECCPIVPTAMEGRQVLQWDKDSCGDAGFLKIDLLGLGMLSCVERCVELISSVRGDKIDLSQIDFDDPQVYTAIQAAETMGVFQIESRAQMGSLMRTRPETLDDLTVQVAIVRPGPITGGAINPYIERRQRRRVNPDYEIPFEHPSLKGPLEETLGTIIFQDQVLEVAQSFAGYTAGEAESLRRAMSRKRSEAALKAHQERFVRGAMHAHPDVTQELAEEIFRKILGFSGFGFPKAHSAAFAVLAYQSTWLRVHYGPEFLCSLLDEQPMGFYPPDTLVHEAQRRGIQVLAPDINASDVGCTIEPALGADGRPLVAGPGVGPASHAGAQRAAVTHSSAVRIGLGYVLGVRERDVAALVAERKRGGAFRTLDDLAARAGAGRAALEQLAWSGVCDGLAGGDRRHALWQLGVAVPAGRVKGAVQLALPLDLPDVPALSPMSRWQTMLADYATTGLTTGHHPLALLRRRLDGRRVTKSDDLFTLRHGTTVTVAGFVVARQRPGTAKGVTFMLLEDEAGTTNLVIPPPVAERHRLIVRSEPLVIATGRLERHASAGGQINIVVQRLEGIAGGALAPQRPVAEQIPLEAGLARKQESQARRLPEVAAQEHGGEDAGDAADFRTVAPPVMSFAQGRRR
ncbi:MAG: DNA polymerase III subunit alpha [Solirubrobacteraceae bacterium]|nr:DNA polymerase III subunit alpha [Solirubrobacteraceae bacterium]